MPPVSFPMSQIPLLLIITTALLLIDLSIQDIRTRRIESRGLVVYWGLLGFAWPSALLLALPDYRVLVSFAVISGLFAIGYIAKKKGLIGGGDVLVLSGISILMLPVFSTTQVLLFWLLSFLSGAGLILWYHRVGKTAPFMLAILAGFILAVL